MNIDTFPVNKQETTHVHVISPSFNLMTFSYTGTANSRNSQKTWSFFVAVDQKHKYISAAKSGPSVFKPDNIKLEHW